MAKIHYGQESPRDQIHTLIGAIRGEAHNTIDETSKDPKKNAKHILFLLDIIEGVLPHIQGVNWNPELPLECEVQGDEY